MADIIIKIVQIWKEYVGKCFLVFYGLTWGRTSTVLLLIPFEIVKCTQFDVLGACSGGVLFFFFQPAAGLTNRVPVRDSRAGAPLIICCIKFVFQVSNDCWGEEKAL
jgi:hypothetical protein